MKNSNGMIAGLLTVALLVGGASGWLLASYVEETAGNYGNEMKLEYRTNYADGGANTVERNGDHEDSPYFYHVDFYNAKSGDGLYILPQFKTIQQTSELYGDGTGLLRPAWRLERGEPCRTAGGSRGAAHRHLPESDY